MFAASGAECAKLKTDWKEYANASLPRPEWALVREIPEALAIVGPHVERLLSGFQDALRPQPQLESLAREIHSALLEHPMVGTHRAYSVLAFAIHTAAFVHQERFGDHDGGAAPRAISPDAVIGDRAAVGRLKILGKEVPGTLYYAISPISGIVLSFFVSNPRSATGALRRELRRLDDICIKLDKGESCTTGLTTLFEFEEVARTWLSALEAIYPDAADPPETIAINRVVVLTPSVHPSADDDRALVPLGEAYAVGSKIFYLGRPLWLSGDWRFVEEPQVPLSQLPVFSD